MIWHVYIRTDDVEVVNVDDDLVAMMSGGVLDVEPSLISRNTLGNGKTANSKSQTSNVRMVVAESGGGLHSAMRKWGDGLCELKLRSPSLSSRNTLGDTTHNSNKLKQKGG
jgi:hypothetical protein